MSKEYQLIAKVLITTLIAICHSSYGQIYMKGQLHLDSAWSKEIYVSKIPTLFDMHNAGNHLILMKSNVDSAGNWSLSMPELANHQLIRLHVKKKSDPVNSLIIGTKDENHGFYGIGPRVDTLVIRRRGTRIFNNFRVGKSQLNKDLRIIDSIKSQWGTQDQATVDIEIRHTLRKATIEKLLYISDTSQNLLTAIFACHLANFGFNKVEIEKTMNKIENEFGEHQYLYSSSIRPSSNHTIYFKIFVGLLILVLMYIAYRKLQKDKKRKVYNSLSYREREVVILILTGKTNKEIGLHLNVEISTVKSHVKRIFNKLKVSSRKELSKYAYLSSKENKTNLP